VVWIAVCYTKAKGFDWVACTSNVDGFGGGGRLNADGYDVGGDMAGRWNSGGTYCGSDFEFDGLRWSGSGLVVDFVMCIAVMNATVSKCTFSGRLEGKGCACIIPHVGEEKKATLLRTRQI